LNDKQVAEALASPATITQTTFVTLPVATLLRDVGNRLTISRGPGEGRLYYTAHLKAYLPVPSIKAADRGIAVQRRYVLASCTDGVADGKANGRCAEVTSAKVGDVIRVELTIIAPSDLHYVQLEDPLPAGAEAIDTGLATTSQLAASASLNPSTNQPNYYRWWWNWYSRSELRDDRMALFATFLSKGTYEYSYTMRVTSAGQFNVIPTLVNEQYFPEVFGRSDGRLLSVTK
jgi:alpha-2-macroglobulin